ncbi:hypothetical protein I79_014334 [Cricetulus griseus]|uniref:Uncharacterized protein n=1 Tax=Cricetulus griseus TaxID=10029 RepID=G3HTV5_CRIGR|nr:hypothetical protein I79_014334 [Cricetulus griseus]
MAEAPPRAPVRLLRKGAGGTAQEDTSVPSITGAALRWPRTLLGRDPSHPCPPSDALGAGAAPSGSTPAPPCSFSSSRVLALSSSRGCGVSFDEMSFLEQRGREESPALSLVTLG